MGYPSPNFCLCAFLGGHRGFLSREPYSSLKGFLQDYYESLGLGFRVLIGVP